MVQNSKICLILRGTILLVAFSLLPSSGECQDSTAEKFQPTKTRINSGLILLYDFKNASEGTIADVSGIEPEIKLKEETNKGVVFSEGTIDIESTSLIRSNEIAPRIAASVIRSGELTLEAWIKPAPLSQKGPARIFSYSRDPNDRNFTIGQEGDKFEFRVRSTQTSNNGIPSLLTKSGAATTDLTHLVYTRDRTGRTRIYIDGELNVESMQQGDLSNWTADFHVAIGNEMTKDRPWLGRIELLAVYQRDLLPREVKHNFSVGSGAKTLRVTKTDPAHSIQSDMFTSKVAPIIAQHCLECHDSSTKDGGLDLSKRKMAFSGSDSGKSILPGKPYDSAFWTQVVSNEMPQDRDPLSAREKQILKEWIDGGAVWTGEDIDPAVLPNDDKEVQVWVRRLTVPQYIATVKYSVGVDIAKQARKLLPPDLRADGFNNTAYNLSIDLKHVSAYAQLAALIVERVDVERFAGRFVSQPDLSTANVRELIANMGKLIFRGPVEDHEYKPYLKIAELVELGGGDFHEAAGLILEAMLQAPRFIYQIENQHGDGSRYPVGDYELASRLSYIIWGAPPDQALIAAVDRGEFYDRSGVPKQVDRMLDDPRVIDRSVEFLSQWLDLNRLDNLQPNKTTFPNWNKQLAADMKLETIEFFKEVVWEQQRPLVDILNAQVTFATPELAAHYGLESDVGLRPAPAPAPTSGLKRFELTTNPQRGGILTQGSVLTMGGDEASMVTRGLFVLRDLLRGVVKDPPPCIDTSPVATKPGLTQRMIAQQRIANRNCGGCHSRFEPLAFGLERFDGLGSYHETDHHGNKLRDDGEVLFPGDSKPVPFKSSAELMNLLAQNDRVRENLTWKLIQFSIGRPLTSADVQAVKNIHRAANDASSKIDAQIESATYRSLIKAIVLSDLVQTTKTEIRQKK